MMRTCLAALLGLVMSAGTAAAQCTVPNTLTNNTNADATQVMANFNALLTCINSLPSPTGNPGFMNRLRNGSFVSWPNGYSGPITTSATGRAAIAANGWSVIPSGASMTWARVAQGNNGTTQSLQATGASGVTNVTIGQRIESFDAAQLAGRTVTFQMAVFNNTGASITPKISTRYVGSADTWTSPVADVTAVDLQACANGVWTVVAYTFTPNAGAANGYEVKIDFGNNFSSTSKSVQVTAAELRMTPGVSAGLNSSPPNPEIPFVEAELRRNARYYQTSYVNGTAPGASTTEAIPGGVPIIFNGIGTISSVPFPTRMRATPTMSYWDGAGATNAVSYIGSGGFTFVNGGTWSIVSTFGPSAHGFYLGYTGSGGPATASYFVHYAAYADFW
jgi:hypothetical protein